MTNRQVAAELGVRKQSVSRWGPGSSSGGWRAE
ncbi:hypothetical protein [Streptomyces sp. NPDC087859]